MSTLSTQRLIFSVNSPGQIEMPVSLDLVVNGVSFWDSGGVVLASHVALDDPVDPVLTQLETPKQPLHLLLKPLPHERPGLVATDHVHPPVRALVVGLPS